MRKFAFLLLLPGCVPIQLLPAPMAGTDTVYSPPSLGYTVEYNPTQEDGWYRVWRDAGMGDAEARERARVMAGMMR